MGLGGRKGIFPDSQLTRYVVWFVAIRELCDSGFRGQCQGSRALLVAEAFDRIKLGGAIGRDGTEDDAHQRRDHDGNDGRQS
jgi:hypothetical protein